MHLVVVHVREICIAYDAVARHVGFAAGTGQHPRDLVDQSRLARAVVPQQGENLPAVDVEG